MRTRLVSTCSLGLAAMLAVAACGEKARGGTTAVSVTEIDLGRSLKPDLTIEDNTNTFKPSDVIYTSIETKGAGPATLTVRWTTKNDQLVDETSRTVSPADDRPARTEFHLSKPDGWPEGEYHLTVLLDGRKVGEKDFEVKR